MKPHPDLSKLYSIKSENDVKSGSILKKNLKIVHVLPMIILNKAKQNAINGFRSVREFGCFLSVTRLKLMFPYSFFQ